MEQKKNSIKFDKTLFLFFNKPLKLRIDSDIKKSIQIFIPKLYILHQFKINKRFQPSENRENNKIRKVGKHTRKNDNI